MHSVHDCIRGLLVLSFSFLLVFTSYNAIENLETSIIPGNCEGCRVSTANAVCQLGDVCAAKVQFSCDVATTLGVIYLVFMLSSMLGPVIPNMIGEKLSLIGSSTCYGLFAVANIIVALNPTATSLHWWVLIPSSALIGFAASVLWVCNGSYLTRLAVYYAQFKGLPETSSMGFMNGTFFAIFKVSQLTGNILSSFVLGTLQWSTAWLFTVYAALSFFGTLLMCFLEPLNKPTALPKENTKLLSPSSPSSSTLSIQAVWNLAKDGRMLVLLPLMLFNGIQQGFTSSEFTTNFIRESLGEASIGYVMAVFGAMNVVFSIGVGRLADKVGTMWAQLLGCFAQTVVYALCLWAPIEKCDGQWTLILACAVLLSLGDAVVLGQEFSDDAMTAFSLFQVYHSASASVVFFFLNLTWRLYVLLVSAVLAAASIALYTRRKMRSAADCFRGVLILAFAFLLVFTSYNAIEPGLRKPDMYRFPERDLTHAFSHVRWLQCYGSVPFQWSLRRQVRPMTMKHWCYAFKDAIGEKWSLIGSSTCYGIFALANIVVALNPTAAALHWWILIPASTLIGLSASVLWGSYITRLSVYYAQFKHLPETSSMGLMNGTFSAIYKASQLTGNALSSFLLGTLSWSAASLFTTYAALSFLGTGLMCFLEPLKKLETLPQPQEKTKLLSPGSLDSPLTSMREVWALTKDRRMLVLLPLMLFTGIQQGFTSSEFTSSFIRESLGAASIGYVMAVFGGTSVFFSYVLGRLTDKVGPMWVQLLACAAQFLAYSLCLWIPITKCDEQWSLILGCAVLLSLGEAGQEFTANALSAFSLFRVYHSGAASLSFFGLQYLSLVGRLYVLLLSTALAAASIVLYACRYRTVV
ncbi:UNC93-like protein 3-like [Achlya hypogyna]|uniref:UNC93-like protein 3-like n=1 Tax=Achlya hypogyna TaxID=1202772 RepID=A0A1V9ZSG4_ACHHY|nr:UNC93-like protein 3-like [Achlya hypogyna]